MSLATTIVSIIFFSLISTLLPKEFPIWIIFILYTIMTMILILFLQKFKAKRKVAEIKGVSVFKVDEKNVMDIAMRDQELLHEISRQSGRMFLYMLILIIFMFSIIPYIHGTILNIGDSISVQEKFLRYLAFYSILWGLMYILRLIIMPKKMLMPITRYEVFSTGIKAGSTWINFPLDKKRYKINIDHKRGYIEIYDLKSRYAHRFYSNDTYKLYTLIEKYGLRSEHATMGNT